MEKLYELERIRKEKGLTMADLSKLSGVQAITIHSLEQGKTNVNNVKLSTLIALAKALHVKVVDLLGNDLKKIIG